ncbi:hypothetical protein BJV77DRAFT_217753 [Russula vinacea]|nr:hypothetical protein BJV77DRAFT_217753 [Russula vinacea]
MSFFLTTLCRLRGESVCLVLSFYPFAYLSSGHSSGAGHGTSARIHRRFCEDLKDPRGMGGVGPPLRGFGTHPAHRLSTGTGTPPTHHASPEPTLQNFIVSRASYRDAPRPDIVIAPPACEPQGLQSTVVLGNGYGVSLPTVSQSSGRVYRTPESIEDRQRIFDQGILPRRPRECFFHLTWLALRGKVFVLLSIYTIVSLAFGLFHVFGTTRPPGSPSKLGRGWTCNDGPNIHLLAIHPVLSQHTNSASLTLVTTRTLLSRTTV